MPKDFIPDDEFVSDEDPSKEAEGDQVGQDFIPTSQYFADGGATDFIPDNQFTPDADGQPQVDNSSVNQTQDRAPASFIPDDQFVSDDEKYGTPEQAAKATLEGVGRGLVGPLAPMAEEALGVNPEDIRARERVNEPAHILGEATGLIAPTVLTGGASTLAKFTQAGALKAVEKGLEQAGIVAGDTLASKIGSIAAKQAIDNALISGSDEVSKMILNDPEQSVASAMTSVGLSGAIGGIVGGAFGGMSPLWKASQGSKTSGVIKDFIARIQEHAENPDPVNSVTNELRNLYDSIKEVPVFGEKGIKSRAIAEAMPEMNDKIAQQVSDNIGKLENTVNVDLAGDPHKGLIDAQLAKYRQALNTEDPAQVFNATQELKQQLQEWGRYNKDIAPLAERNFRDTAKGLATQIKEGLEDTSVWGNAAIIQKKINNAFTDFLPNLQDVEKTFTKKMSDGTREFDPGKINTYINQLGKPNAEIKQGVVRDFLDSAEKYKSAIDDAYSSVGEESPFEPVSLNVTKSTLKEKTLGSKLADIFLSNGLKHAGGEGLAGIVGAGVSSRLGIPKEIGAIIGARALGPFFSSTLGALSKSLVSNKVSSSGFKVATNYATQVALGEKLINNAAKGVFMSGASVLSDNLRPTKEHLSKLDDQLKTLQTNVDPLLHGDQHLQHYLPNHDDSLTKAVSTATNYLNSIRKTKDKQSPLDSEPVISKVDKAEYDNALRIAEQPLSILENIKDGSISANDIKHLQFMYPNLYHKLQQKLTNQMIDHINKHETVPYKTRIGLSMFMAQPLDSTMAPASIIAAQPTKMGGSGPMPASSSSKRGGSPSSPALQKMPGLYQTPSQNRLQRQQTKN